MQNHIRKIREQNKLSLENVAQKLGVTKAMVSKIERGLLRVSDHWLDKFSKLSTKRQLCCVNTGFFPTRIFIYSASG